FRITEGDKTRVQLFSGVVIGKKGTGINEMFTVRRISYGEGVERVFPLYSPLIESIEVTKQGKTRRSKLYYLRERTGKKATKVKEKLGE
ncbi:MAG TPA: 50S ribosomal protein L19, partial [Candidatus Omnitrophota bacterium]|nr:50S ribosomal protein L19 [Candidatus Omnitrophota bacterium]